MIEETVQFPLTKKISRYRIGLTFSINQRSLMTLSVSFSLNLTYLAVLLRLKLGKTPCNQSRNFHQSDSTCKSQKYPRYNIEPEA